MDNENKGNELAEAKSVIKEIIDGIDLNNLGEFDLTRQKAHFKLKNTKGVLGDYYLQELSGAEREAQQQEQIDNHMERDANGDLRITKWIGFYGTLLSRTLFTAEGKAVPIAEFSEWPDHVQQKLYLASKKLSKLTQEAKAEAAKNS